MIISRHCSVINASQPRNLLQLSKQAVHPLHSMHQNTNVKAQIDPSVSTIKSDIYLSRNLQSIAQMNRIRGGESILPTINPTIAFASLGATTQLLSAIGLGALAASRPNVLDAGKFVTSLKKMTAIIFSQYAKHYSMHNEAAVKALSRLAYNVFQPAFLLCNVVNTLASGSANSESGGIPKVSLILMPFISLLQIIVGSIFSKFVVNLSKIEGEEKCDSRVCMTFVNSATLPFIFSAALFKDNPALMTDVSACLSFYLLVWSPAFWTYGRSLLLSNSETIEKENTSQASNLIIGLQKLFSPPVIGSTIGIIIGSIPMLRNAVLQDGIFSPVFRATKTLGSAYLPAAILVLSGSLGGSKNKKVVQSQDQPIRSRTLLSILFARFIVSPASSYFALRLLGKYTNILPPVGTTARAVVSFIILMEGCMPPAQNSVLILQLAGCKERAERMAKMLTFIYVISIIPITVLMSLALQLSGVMSL